METKIIAFGNLKSLINNVVGYVKINKSWVNHNNSYECAAWWEDSSIKEGVYPLILKKNNFAPYNVYLEARLEAIVIDDFFPALWAGSPISNKPYIPQNVGEKRYIYKSFDIVQSINKTGDIEGSDIDTCVNPFVWDSVIESIRQSMHEMHKSYHTWFDKYQTCGDGDYNANISMIEYCSNNIMQLSKALNLLKDKQKYSNYIGDNYSKNINWIQAA